MSTRAYGRTSWPWAAAAVLLFWQTWYVCHVFATEYSGVRWECDPDGCATNQLAGGALFIAVPSLIAAAVIAAPFLGAAGAGIALLLAAFGLLMDREDDEAVVWAYGLAALGAVLVVAGVVRAIHHRGGGPSDTAEPQDPAAGPQAGDPVPETAPAGAARLPLRALLRQAAAPATLVTAVPAAVATTALVHGVLEGPRWAMMLGLNGTVALLVVLGQARLRHRPGVARGPVTGPDAAHSPARLHALTTRGTSFVFDLTVLPDAGDPYRIEVEHPLDLQHVHVHRAAVVRHDPRRPWRVDLPQHPPAAALSRARADAARAEDIPPAARLRVPAPGTAALTIAVLLAAVLTTALAMA
ncbi:MULTISPECIES: hypothetical protein [unclassified Streptomyces]|uniref:hypothetical protein n=1 Tax=unclassified Streptomyces TaxID=2593676 RepID=UPI0006F33607|nr:MULTISPECIES: hypothetical protein [unclassified Streptomyces]KQX55741.1 hypothetical protein ASD33_30650 [Streptomyces sp. Root1304]KRA96338.1 hypothetical protein ASE09_27415 [Streptomyces sp. Root66D1]